MPRPTPVQRFRASYAVDPSGCWLWTKSLTAGGYAQFRYGGKTGSGHRFAYLAFVGTIPAGHHIDHLCRVRHCVNPAHLEAVTPQENTLRGQSSSALNARKTHCKRGHPFDDANTLIDGRGGRRCRACQRAATADYWQRHPLTAGDPRHGAMGYAAAGCRCDICSAGMSAYQKAYRRRAKA